MLSTLKKDKYSGVKFYNSSMDIYEVLGYSDRYKGYLLSKNGVMNGMYDIEQASYIDFMLSKQDKYIEDNKRWIEQQQLEKEQEEKEKFEYENVYGYLDNKTPLQKGKILKILNTKTSYSKDGMNLGYMARKDFLYKMIREGYEVEHKKDLKYWGKDYELKVKANEYRLVAPDKSFYEITKTEYDYANYLINNILNITA